MNRLQDKPELSYLDALRAIRKFLREEIRGKYNSSPESVTNFHAALLSVTATTLLAVAKTKLGSEEIAAKHFRELAIKLNETASAYVKENFGEDGEPLA